MVGASNGDACKLGLIASMAATRKPLKGHYSAFDASAGLSLSGRNTTDGSDLKAYELRQGSAAYRFARKNEPHLTLRHTPGRKNSCGNVTDDLNHLIGCVG